MRIAVFTPLFPTNSDHARGTFNYKIACSLQRHAQVKVFCPVATFPSWKFLQPRSMRYHRVNPDHRLQEIDVEYTLYPTLPFVGRHINPLSCYLRTRQRVMAYRPDLILAYWLYPEGLAAVRIARELGVPLLMGTLGSDLLYPGSAISRRLRRWTLSGADQVITLSREMTEQALSYGVAADRIHTIYNGCDLNVFHPSDRIQARQELGVAEDAELILFVGWLSRTKGLDLLLQSFETLRTQRPALTLVCVGEGPLHEAIESLHSSGRCPPSSLQMTGRLRPPDIARWLAAANLLCLPSDSEGCPNVVVEAQSCGRPVVATRVGGIPEMVSAETGILIARRDQEALTQALDQALSRNWDEPAIARANRRSWDSVADETMALCRQTLEAAQSHRGHR